MGLICFYGADILIFAPYFYIMGKRKKSVKKERKAKLEKPRNHGSMTESGFWGFIRSALRQKSRWWKPILECKRRNRRPYKGPNKRQKWEVQCNICKNWFMDKFINVDHIKPVGTLKSASDLPLFIENLFCEIDNLQCACKKCHDDKTNLERK